MDVEAFAFAKSITLKVHISRIDPYKLFSNNSKLLNSKQQRTAKGGFQIRFAGAAKKPT